MATVRSVQLLACSSSLVFHLGLFVLGAVSTGVWSTHSAPALIVQPDGSAQGMTSGSFEVEVEVAAAAVAHAVLPAEPAAAYPERLARPDLERSGSGGEAEVTTPAVHLASSLDGLSLMRETPNVSVESQVQRLRVAEARRTREDLRATPSPEQRALVASGAGQAPLRPTLAVRSEPSLVAAHAAGSLEEAGVEPNASAAGSAGVAVAAFPLAPAQPEAQHLRPAVTQGPASVPSEQRGRTVDNRDSALAVAPSEAALLLASTAGGVPGSGRGGQAGRAPLGWGDRARFGSRSEPRGDGHDGVAPAAADIAADPYFVLLKQKLRPHSERAFPSWAIARGLSGQAIVAWTIRQDGSVSDVRLLRSSGIAEYDNNVLLAVRRAAPFPRVPASLGARALALTMNFDSTNPVIGRSERSLPVTPDH